MIINNNNNNSLLQRSVFLLVNGLEQKQRRSHFTMRKPNHYDDDIMGAMASQITSLTIVYSTVYSGADQSKHQSSASLAFVWGTGDR